MLKMQRELQINSFGLDPARLEGDALAEFIRWNILALEDELHEALAEVGWKPWATSRHVNSDAFLAEMVDAWHFFMNLLLATLPDLSTEDIANAFYLKYTQKRKVNAERQEEGYDGVSSKCPTCHRELTETSKINHVFVNGILYCTHRCYQQSSDNSSYSES